MTLTRKTPLTRTGFKPAAPKPPRGPRQRKCSNCGTSFQPDRMGQKVCGIPCAHSYARRIKEQQERKELKARKQATKSRRDWEKEAQQAVNAWVRLVRDADKTCISCGRWHDGQWHCGHYLSRGARPGLRYVEANLAKQCAPCNVHLSGNQVNFRLGLIARIGLAAVEALEADDTPRKYSIDDLKAIRDEYRARLRALKAAHD